MKTKSLLTALALPAIFAACTNEELVESIENQQPIQEIVGADLVNKGLSINVGSGVESRMTADGDWTLTDKLGLGWLDAVGNITATQSPTGTSIDATLYANHMFQKAEEGGDFTTYGNVYEGYHFAYYPYARMNKVEAKTIANVNVKQTEAFETDKYNKALWLSPQIYLTASDVKEDRLDTKKSFALNRVVNVLHVRTAIDQAILNETALTALSFSSVTADLNGKAAFSLNANLNPRLLPVATYDEKKGEMVLDKEWTVENLVGVNSNFAIDRGSAATLTTEVEGDFASLSNSSISVRMFTLPTFNVSVAATDVTFTFTTGAGYFTVKYTPTKDAAGKDVQLTAIQETNNDAIEKLLAFLSKEGFQKGEKSYTLQGFLGNSYPSLDFTLDKSMFTPDYSDIQSETDWNACVAIANALGNDDVTFNVTKSFAFAGEIQTPNVKNFYVTTAQGQAITVGTAEGITWPEEIKVPTTTQGSSLSVIVAKDAVLNVEGTEEAPATMNATRIANKGIINVNAWAAVSDGTSKALDNTEGRVVVEYGAYVYPAETNKEGIIAYVVDNTEKENIAKINILIKENNLRGYANVNTLVVKTDMDLNALAADEIANDRYEDGSIATYLSDLKNINIELEGGSLSKVLEGTNNTVQNVTATAGVNVLNYGVKVVNNITVAEDATLTIENAADTKDYKANVIKNDLHVDGTLFVNVVMNVKNVINHNSGNITVAPRFGIYYTTNYVQEGTASGRIEKLVANKGTEVTPTNPDATTIKYSVATAKDLQWLAGKTYTELASANGLTKIVIELAADIDMQNAPFKGINGYVTGNKAVDVEFDGKGYTIKNLLLADAELPGLENRTGLFGGTRADKTTTIKNLIIDGVSFEEQGLNNSGALIGYQEGTANIENVTVKNATLIGNGEIGGLIGQVNHSASIKNSKVEDSIIKSTNETANVYSGSPAGGLVGFFLGQNLTFTGCEVNGGNIEAASGICGNFVGSMYNNSGKIIVDGNDSTPTSFPNGEGYSIGF